jgi:FkbM family methyltransferase
MQRMTFGGLDLAVIDPHERDTRYIYDEVFVSQIYYHPEMRIPKHPVIMDVGANIGLYSVWAYRRYQPRDIYCYEASPRTFPYLVANTKSLVDPEITRIHLFNRALSSRSGQQLTLHQSPLVSGISTLLGGDKVRWVQGLTESGEIMTHQVVTSTVSDELAANKIASIDLLKIDVEGFFMEVLKGIAEPDFPRISNVVVEVDYSDQIGATAHDVEELLAPKGYQTDRHEDMLYAWRR